MEERTHVRSVLSLRFAAALAAVVGLVGLGLQPVTALAVTSTGLTWTQSTFAGDDWLFQPSCLSSSICFVAGAKRLPDGSAGSGTIYRSTNAGATWASTSEIGPSVAPDGLSGLKCISGANTCIAVGGSGLILRTTNASAATPTWASVTDPNPTDNLYAVNCLTKNLCFAVGDGSQRILKSTDVGASWTSNTTPNTNILFAVTCSGGRCTAVGLNGQVITNANAATANVWTPQVSGVTTGLAGVWCQNANACVTAAGNGVVLSTKTGGSSWTSNITGTTVQFTGSGCLSTVVCTVVGLQGQIYTTVDSFASWNADDSTTPNELDGATCGFGYCLASGALGTIVKGS